ncbi:MAG: MFS transporter [Alphaproteobacteria bacterium]|nr:MFS transporter [Alphaproteobacteria bacterium]
MRSLRLAAYALPAVPLAAAGIPLFIYLPVFYSREMGLDLAVVGAILFLARVWDVITDPLVGILSDRTSGRFGRRRPWILAGTLPLVLAIHALFLPPSGAGAAHLLVWIMILYLAWTMITLPYQSWGAELSADYDERTRIAGWREGGVILGTTIATSLPIFVTGQDGNAGPVLVILGWLVIIALPVAVLLALALTPDAPHRAGPPLPWRQGMAVLAANAPFRRLIAAYLLNGIANGLPATLFLLFVAQVIGAPGQTGLLLFLYFASGVLAVPFWLRLSARMGKHRAWALSMLWVSLVFAAVPFLGEGDFWPYLLVCILSGAGLGADLALPTAMQADVVDVDAAATGQRRTGLYFALWGMATKLALAAAVGIAFPVLDLAGFSTSGPNDAAALFTVKALYGLLPLAFKIIAIALVWRFPLGRPQGEKTR